MRKALIRDSNDAGAKPDDSWAVRFKEWIESHYTILSVFPGYRSSLRGEDILNEAWWAAAEQQLQRAEKVARTHGHPTRPSLESHSIYSQWYTTARKLVQCEIIAQHHS
jgi:hypothetical protein